MPVPSGTTNDALSAGLCQSWEPLWPVGCALPTTDVAVQDTALAMASEVLYALTARQFGLCTTTLRPCRRECYGASWWQGNNWLPFTQTITPRAGSYWLGMSCGSCGSDCSCANVSEVALPGPIYFVTEVKVDGVALVPDVDYRLDNNRLLVRLGAEWPTCNNLNLADTQPGTWSVTAEAGVPVPVLGQTAVGILAIEFMKALLCSNDCMLPKPVQSIARQGVNVTFLDPNEVFANGRIGLYIPDLFIQTYNPDGRRSRAKVYNLDAMSNTRRLGV